jgi:hypothetical protein
MHAAGPIALGMDTTDRPEIDDLHIDLDHAVQTYFTVEGTKE